MKSFDEWTEEIAAQSAKEKTMTWQSMEDEGHGFISENNFMIRCCCCERNFAISDYIDAEEFDPDVPETFYCGGSDRCCP